MAQNASDQSHCKIFKTLVSQDIIKLWSWFSTCDYTFLDPTNYFNHFTFVSSGKHWFPDDSNHVINGGHNDDNSDNDNYVGYNVENDVNFMVIIITVAATKMIMKITMIKIIMVKIIVIMTMVKLIVRITIHWFMDGF